VYEYYSIHVHMTYTNRHDLWMQLFENCSTRFVQAVWPFHSKYRGWRDRDDPISKKKTLKIDRYIVQGKMSWVVLMYMRRDRTQRVKTHMTL
jgi:hypothetical protein